MGMGRWIGARILAVLLLAVAGSVWAGEPHEEFARNIGQTQGAKVAVNLREDRSLGAIAVALLPALVADRKTLDPLMAQIGAYGMAHQLGATVVTPKVEDRDYLVERLKAAGISRIKTQAMADFVSIKTTRVFLVPLR